MSEQSLVPRGVGAAKDKAVTGERIDSESIRVTIGATLRDLAAEYCLFTDALLYTKLPLGPLNPYIEFCASKNLSLPRQDVRSDRPFFRGLNVGGDAEWNHRIGLMPKKHWNDFCQFYGSLAFRNQDTGLVARVRTQHLLVVDELDLAKQVSLPNKIPRVRITAFVLDSNKGCVYYKYPHIMDSVLPTPYVFPDRRVYADTEVFAYELINNKHDPDPYGAVDAARTLSIGEPVEQVELKARLTKEASDADRDSVPPAGD